MKAGFVCVLWLLVCLPCWAQDGDGLKGEYFNTIDLTGSARIRIDKTIDFQWGFNAPLTGINNDNFSIRWTGQLLAPATGSYTFTTYSDDGVRVWVNGKKIVENWTAHDPTYNESAPVNLVAGRKYDLKVAPYLGSDGSRLQAGQSKSTGYSLLSLCGVWLVLQERRGANQ